LIIIDIRPINYNNTLAPIKPQSKQIMTTLTDSPKFQLLLPIAKAWAQAEQAPKLALRHVLLAAEQLTLQGSLELPDGAEALTAYSSAYPPKSSPPTLPVDVKLPLSDDLKAALANASDDLGTWLTQCAQSLLLKGTSTSAEDPLLNALKPWLLAATRSLGDSSVSSKSLALALHAALGAKAFDAQPGFAYWVEGHLDELTDWLNLCGLKCDELSPALDDVELSLHADFETALGRVDDKAFMPSMAWKWAHATINAANEERRTVQVAYHEAGHAVALHVLSPEMVFRKITIQPEGNRGGYVESSLNTGFAQIYLHSLEQALEDIVVTLSGRAAEVHLFGHARADSGAVNDIRSATGTAWLAITAFGLDPDMGMVSLSAAQNIKGPETISPMASQGWLHDLAQQRLHAWMRWGQSEAMALVQACWPMIEALARSLIQHKTLDNDQARGILRQLKHEIPPYRLRPLPSQTHTPDNPK
jgi:hypothetical protein